MRRHSPTLVKLLIVNLLAMLAASCAREQYISLEGEAWHTLYHITYEGNADLSADIRTVMEQIDSTLSPFNPGSEVSRLNRTDSLCPSPMLSRVFARSREIWSLTGGYFDPSAAPLIDAYGFGAGKTVAPDSLNVSELLEYVGMDKARLNSGMLVKSDPRMSFNFSALAKGFGVDCIAEALRRHGIGNYMVEVGGEIACAGKNPSGSKWRISVDAPVESADREVHISQLVIELSEAAVATSGNYRNFHESGGKKIGHIVNPKTGLPAISEIASATVIAPDCITADALATALMSMPRTEAEALIKRENLAVLLIYTSGKTFASPAFRPYLAQ